MADHRPLAYLATVLLGSASALSAVEYAPRVLSPHVADGYSMKTFGEFHRWKDLAGDERAFAIYRYLVDKQTGIYPMGTGAHEGSESFGEFSTIRDPVKNFNIYPMGYCGVLGPTIEGIMTRSGTGLGRTVQMPGYHHTFAEVQLGDHWGYLDLDIRLIFRKEDGTLASTAEARRDPSLWEGERSDWRLPLGRLGKTREIYRKNDVHYRAGYHQGGHTMDYVLRRGETFTRWWHPQGNRWQHSDNLNKGGPRKIMERQPEGPKGKHRHWSEYTRGNGRFVYAPDLSDASIDFADGVYDSAGVAPATDGLRVQDAENGFATFEVRSPYIIVPRVGAYEDRADDRDASVVQIAGSGLDVSVSTDYGKNWSSVDIGDGTLDLTRFASGRYQYLLRIAFADADSVLSSLEITTWVMLHPASLPALRAGTNQMRYVTGDHYGQQTRVMEIRPFLSEPDEFRKWCSDPPDTIHDKVTGRVTDDFVVHVPAMPHTRISWFSGGASFRAHQRQRAPKTDNRMAYATSADGEFVQFYKSEIPTWHGHWHYNADVEVQLEEPAEDVYIKYQPDPALNNIRIYAHCIDQREFADAPVSVRHVWKVGDEEQEFSTELDGEGGYEITCEGEPENILVELAVPSSRP